MSTVRNVKIRIMASRRRRKNKEEVLPLRNVTVKKKSRREN